MATLIGLEIKKLLFRKKTLITTIAFLLLIGLVAFGTYKEDENRRKWESPEFQIQNMEQSIQSLKAQMNDPNAPEGFKKDIPNQIVKLEEMIKQLKANPKANEANWKEQLQGNTDSMKKQLDVPMDSQSKERMKSEIEQNEYLLKHDIKPDTNRLTAFSFLVFLFEGMGFIFLAVGVGLFTADMVSGECTPPTLKLLLTQPVSRRKVLLSKFIAVISSATIMIVAIELISYVVMGLIFGFGDFNYPMFVGTRYKFDMNQVVNGTHPLVSVAGSTYIITRGAFLIRMFLIQVLAIITVASFAFMLSSIFKSSMVSVSLSIVTPVILFILSNIQSLSKFNIFMFTNHLGSENIIKGQMATRFNNPMLTPTFSIILLVVWIVVCYGISHLIFTKKDILI